MKKTISQILAILCVLLLIGPAFAIDKTKKDPDPNQQAKKTEVDKNKDTSQIKKDESKKKLNDFIDANGNGIDDRAEKKTATPKTSKSDPPKKTTP